MNGLMSKAARILLAAALLLGLGVLGLLLVEGDGARSSAASSEDRTVSTSDPRTEGAETDLAAPSDPAQHSVPSAQAAAGSAERERRSASDLPGDRENFDLESAIWVDVTVILPPGVPSDDAPALLSFSRRGDEGERFPVWDLIRAAQMVDLSEGFEERIGEDIAWARRELAGSTSARVPFHPKAETGLLILQSRYVYAEPVEVHLVGEIPPATVEGELGAWVTGKLIVPEETNDELGPDDFQVTFVGRDKEGSLNFATIGEYSLDVGVRDDLTFELRALSASKKYFVEAEARGLVDFVEMNLLVEPGEHRVFDVAFELGGSISGRILASNGSAIEGADVHASSRGTGLMFFIGNEESVTSDAEGMYELRGIPAGKTHLQVNASGWLPRHELELELAAGESITGYDIVLEGGGVISGRVVWPSGSPAANAAVNIGKTSPEGWAEFQEHLSCDEDGRFAASGLREGPFDLGASHAPDASVAPDADLARGDWRAVARGVEPNGSVILLTLEEPQTLAGRVVDDTGAPIPSFHVSAELAGAAGWLLGSPNEAVESADGSFELWGFFPGEWRLQASATGYSSSKEPVRVAIPYSGPPIVIPLARAVSVAGIVVDPDGNLVPEATVTASVGTSGPFGGSDSSHQTASDATGRFSFEIPEQAFSLVASHGRWAESEPVMVEVAPGSSRSEVVLALRVGGTITGEIYDARGQPDAGIQVGISPTFLWFGLEQASAVSDASGRFILEHVNPGKATVSAMPREDDLLRAMEEADDEEVAMMGFFGQMRSATVEVVDGEAVHVVLGPKAKDPVRVYGRVTEAGEPLVQAGVFAIEEGGSLLQGMKAAKTDAAGRYEFMIDRPGAFMFAVDIDGSGATAEFFVDVPEAKEFELDLALPLGRISGRVLAPDGSPAAGVSLSLAQEGGSFGFDMLDMSKSRVTDAQGGFAFTHLHPGSYALQAGSAVFMVENSIYGAVVVDGIELGADESRDGLEIRLPAPAGVSGVVRRSDGTPVMGAAIFARDEDGRILSNVSPCRSDAAGRFDYPGLPPGDLSLFARTEELASNEVRIRASEEGSAEVELVLEPGGTLVVSLLDGDEPVRGSLLVLDDDGRRVSGVVSQDAFEALFSEGIQSKELRIGPLPPGTFTVIGTGPDGKEARKTVTLREPGERVVKLRLK